MVYAATVVMLAFYFALVCILISGSMTHSETIACAGVSVLVGYALKTCVIYYRRNKK